MINDSMIGGDKLLVICGPTSTGKTKLALHLSKLFDGEIISADSRQVYKKMDVGTGKDLPLSSQIQFPVLALKKLSIGCYVVNEVKVWGYDLVDLRDDFSVSLYIKFARKVIGNIVSRKKLPILVGGTGLYIKAVVDGIESSGVPRNTKLREMLNDKSVSELFEMLANLNPVKAANLNQSDRKNPRRLIRAIEIAGQKLSGKETRPGAKPAKYSTLFIGLLAPKNVLEKAITKRVYRRVALGIEQEIGELLNSGTTWSMQSMNTLGYKEWLGYFAGKKAKDEVVNEWIKNEKNYAKRQLTWFKKEKRINWFDISILGWGKSVEKLVKKWHNEIHAEKDRNLP